MKTNSAYLENERSIPLYTSLAHTFGVNAAIILQQIRYWMLTYANAEKNQVEAERRHYHDDRWWVYNTYEQWQSDNFGFWSQRTIQRHINKLEELGVLLSGEFNKSSGDRTKWYTIDFDAMDELVSAKVDSLTPSSQTVQTISTNCLDHLDKVAHSNIDTETTTETTAKDSKDSPPTPDELADAKQPHIAVIEDGYLATMAQIGRGVLDAKRDPIKSRVAIASAIVGAGYTWRDVRLFLSWYYSERNTRDDWWKKKTKPMPLEDAAEMMPTCRAAYAPPPPPKKFVVEIPASMEDWARDVNERYETPEMKAQVAAVLAGEGETA